MGAELHPKGLPGVAGVSCPPPLGDRSVFLPWDMPDIVKRDPSSDSLALETTLWNDNGHPCLQISTQRTRRKRLTPVARLSRLGSGI